MASSDQIPALFNAKRSPVGRKTINKNTTTTTFCPSFKLTGSITDWINSMTRISRRTIHDDIGEPAARLFNTMMPAKIAKLIIPARYLERITFVREMGLAQMNLFQPQVLS